MSKFKPNSFMRKGNSNRTLSTINNDIPEEEISFCKSHTNRALVLYCGFCEKPVCEKCKSTTHARHLSDIKNYDALMNAAKSRRRYLTKQIQIKKANVVEKIKCLIVQIGECKAKLQERVTHCIRRYYKYADIHRDKLFVSEEEWADDVMYRASTFYQVMDEKIEFLKFKLNDVTSTLNFIRQELDAANHADLLILFGALRSSLECLHGPKWPLEEVMVSMKLESVPNFGSPLIQNESVRDKNCNVEFTLDIIEPVVYKRVFDTKLPIPKKTLDNENAKISLASSYEMYVSFGEYIMIYPLDSRRYVKVSSNVHCMSVVNVRDNVIDISCDVDRNVYFLTSADLRILTNKRKIKTCFHVTETPSAVSVFARTSNDVEIYIGFHDAGKVSKYTSDGVLLMELTHPDPRMVYRARHLTLNCVGDIFLSDDISNVTILDSNGIWKSAINRDVKTTSACGPLRPNGIATSFQRHVFVIDANAVTNLHIFSEDGKYLQTVAFKNLQDAYAVNVDKTGDVWVAFKDGRIRIYRPSFLENAT